MEPRLAYVAVLLRHRETKYLLKGRALEWVHLRGGGGGGRGEEERERERERGERCKVVQLFNCLWTGRSQDQAPH